jgi:hypothetical protein
MKRGEDVMKLFGMFSTKLCGEQNIVEKSYANGQLPTRRRIRVRKHVTHAATNNSNDFF